ncbi:MAG: isoprenylcysteine carboxylmethyltransferase family protein [Calditrichaceae bacterium]
MNRIITTILIFLFYSMIHSLFAGTRVKRWFRKKFPEYYGLYRITFNILQTTLFIILWYFVPKPSEMLWQMEGVGEYLFRLVQLLAVGGILLTLRDFNTQEFLGIAQMKRYLTGEKSAVTDERYRLNTSGMYAVSRHPLYLFSIMIFLLEPAMTIFKFLILLWLILYFYIGSIFEERRLLTEFGSRYADYKNHVSRIVPVKWIYKQIF